MSRNVVHCATEHGPVAEGPSIPLENTARNILVPGGPTETKNGQVGQHKTTAKIAAADEMSTRRGATGRLFSLAFRPGRMSILHNLV